ncbi:MAG: ATP-dependent DNA helicase [Clostridia bacterium]|nr:ATP-dependent DNA helicase [Clostridia bacterium]
MRYDREKDEFYVSVAEFVESARRGIPTHAPTPFGPQRPESELEPQKFLSEGLTSEELSHTATLDGSTLLISGRADGVKEDELYTVRAFAAEKSAPTKEEISRARGEAFILGFMLAQAKGIDSVLLTIVYINKASGERITTKERVPLKKLSSFFDRCLHLISECAKPEIDRLKVRLPSMKDARFPYGKVREGQREFIGTVYRNLTRGGTLFAQAPTGTGKTVSVLYPAVRALGAERGEKIFYFTPKTTTARAAKDCTEAMCRCGIKIKAVMIGAKERICKRGLLCKESKRLCPSEGEKKVNAAALALFAADVAVVTDAELSAYADAFSVCPHELSLTYSELCDLIICDVNYLFDPRVYIKRYFDCGGRYFFLIDEAHNLPDRAREMYSAEISHSDLAAPALDPVFGEHSALKKAAAKAAELFGELLYPYVKDEIRKDKDGRACGFAHVSEPPSELYSIFEELSRKAEAELFSALRADDDKRDVRVRTIREFSAKIGKVNDALALFDGGYETFIYAEDGNVTLKLFCIDTSNPISERLSRGHAAVFFSATLAPISYYRSVLGDDRSSSTLLVDSPFDSSQLCVSVMDRISTRISEREDTLLAVCRAIAACVSAKRGHYMVFSPSFAYSEALMRAFSAKYPKIKVLLQTKDMSPSQKRDFLSEFENNDGTYLVAFCVTGGIYSEGIDLVGDSLIGAVIVGISMPSLSTEREAIAAYYDEKCDEGKQYAYIYPGMNKVFQAAGRVIRREGDKGVVVLIDDRFADPIYKKSIPDLWRDFEFCQDAKELRARLDEFWKNVGEDTKNSPP